MGFSGGGSAMTTMGSTTLIMSPPWYAQMSDDATPLFWVRHAPVGVDPCMSDPIPTTSEAEAIERVAARWVKDATKMARAEVGDGWSYLSPGMRTGLVCAKLCGILAGQDESARNGHKMARACEMALDIE